MSNLIRSKNQYLLNSVASGTTDCETYTDSGVYGARKVFVHKGNGINFVGNIANEANPPLRVDVFPGGAGTKGVKTVELVGLFNTANTEVEFVIVVTRKARMNGETSEWKDVEHVYNYVKKSFHTSSNGAYDATDVADILSYLAAKINADNKINANAILSGAVVDALYVAEVTDLGAEVPAYIKLTAKDADVRFEVRVDSQVFALDTIDGVPVVQVPSKGKWTDVAQLFPVLAEQAGTLVETPLVGTYYTKIVVTEKSAGAASDFANGEFTQSQVSEIYVPNSYADALNDPLIAQLVLASLTIYKDGVAWT